MGKSGTGEEEIAIHGHCNDEGRWLGCGQGHCASGGLWLGWRPGCFILNGCWSVALLVGGWEGGLRPGGWLLGEPLCCLGPVARPGAWPRLCRGLSGWAYDRAAGLLEPMSRTEPGLLCRMGQVVGLMERPRRF